MIVANQKTKKRIERLLFRQRIVGTTQPSTRSNAHVYSYDNRQSAQTADPLREEKKSDEISKQIMNQLTSLFKCEVEIDGDGDDDGEGKCDGEIDGLGQKLQPFSEQVHKNFNAM
jgi:hypothetical protein